MEITLEGETLRAGPAAREQFYDTRGYGRPRGGDLELAPVEAAHLLFRGDVDAVVDRRTDGDRRLEFGDLLASTAVSEVSFFVYKDLRDRGFYLSPAGERDGEFAVYPRGKGPWDDAVAYRVRALSEREDIAATALFDLARDERTRGDDHAAGDDRTDGGTGVLAVVDEESEVTYLELGTPELSGTTDHDLGQFGGRLLSDRVLVTDPPAALYGRAFYGQRLDPDGPVQLSLVEAAHLAGLGLLDLDAGAPATPEDPDGGLPVLLERGRSVEGSRFDRRLRAYSALRQRGIVPKTGFKFGADFRTYETVESVDQLGHSELLVQVLPGDHVFSPRDLALDVRLAHGVRKRVVFGLADEALSWLAVERLTP